MTLDGRSLLRVDRTFGSGKGQGKTKAKRTGGYDHKPSRFNLAIARYQSEWTAAESRFTTNAHLHVLVRQGRTTTHSVSNRPKLPGLDKLLPPAEWDTLLILVGDGPWTKTLHFSDSYTTTASDEH